MAMIIIRRTKIPPVRAVLKENSRLEYTVQ